MPNNINFKIEKSWRELLNSSFNQAYFKDLITFLETEKELEIQEKTIIFPFEKDIFNAFNYTPVNKVKVVIIGQDPYHSYEEKDDKIIPHAHGLCFSIPKEAEKIPPSLKNIYKELKSDLGYEIPTHGNLTSWAKQGVLMLNATLTVRAHNAGSHQKKGWETFTNTVIKKLSESQTNLVFLLWGKFAQQKEELIDTNKHLVLNAAHPSPFSARNGFFGCNHFSTTNKYLKEKGKEQINWEIK